MELLEIEFIIQKQFKMELAVKTQNKRGNTPLFKENLGYVSTFIDSNNVISVDNYTGIGETYKKREDAEIIVQSEGVISFKGTFKELENELLNAKIYKEAFEEMFTYFDSVSDEQQPKLYKKLQKIGVL